MQAALSFTWGANTIDSHPLVASSGLACELIVPELTTIGKREYTPGILEMTAIYQLYTRKRWMYDKNLVHDWYTRGIYQVHTRLAFLYVSKLKM